MHLSRIDLNLLVVFDTVLAEGSITAAARKLNLSQPAVSHAVGRLRSVFDNPLFERSGRLMVPTPFARSIAAEVRSALGAIERTVNESRSFDPATSERVFRIGLRGALERAALPPLAKAVGTLAPRIGLVSERFDRRRLEQELAAGTIDVALDVLLPVSSRVRHERVMVDRLVVAARRGHPALRGLKRGRWDLATYLAQEHIQVSSRRSGPGLEDMALKALGQSRSVRLRCQGHGTACAIAARTNLVATIPESYVGTASSTGALRILPLGLKGLALETYLYWADNADHDPANAWLRHQLKQSLAVPVASRRPAK
ncbi:MAG: LysR family transcriptional regulator [Gammaproteobacteria bacterium]|nr:LysR family transcriptional regulator [Gammaproteobacteria bacterium]